MEEVIYHRRAIYTEIFDQSIRDTTAKEATAYGLITDKFIYNIPIVSDYPIIKMALLIVPVYA
jgi:hypothetical protein